MVVSALRQVVSGHEKARLQTPGVNTGLPRWRAHHA